MDPQQELENIIQDLEEENSYLIEEYTRLQNQLNYTTTMNKNNKNLFSINKIKTSTLQHNTSNHQQYASDLSNAYHTISSSTRALSTSPTVQQNINPTQYNTSINIKNGNSYNKVPTIFASVNSNKTNNKNANVNSNNNNNNNNNKETQMINEARLLRDHEERLEARMKILENHNRLLDSQLNQLRSLLNTVKFFFFF
jgi:hypothetical protein